MMKIETEGLEIIQRKIEWGTDKVNKVSIPFPEYWEGAEIIVIVTKFSKGLNPNGE